MRINSHVSILSISHLRRLALSGLAAALLLMTGCQSAPSATTAPADTARETPAQQTSTKDAESAARQARLKPATDILYRLAERAWSDLMRSSNSCDDQFDYFPNGGILIFYCHVQEFATYDQIETILDMPVFLSGPHLDGKLDHQSRTSFGYYNPEFVRTIATWALPAARDKQLLRGTQSIYDRGIQPLARTYWATYQKLKANPHYWDAQQSEIQSYLAGDGLPEFYYDKYFVFMNEEFIANRDKPIDYFYDRGFDGAYDGNVVKSAVGFWIRRSIDGTADEFARGLEQLLALYDPSMVAANGPVYDESGMEH